MHGNVAYCKKHGHDWKIIDAGYMDDIPWIQTKCMVCGKEYMTFRLCKEEEQ